MKSTISLSDKEWQEVAGLKEESNRAYERRYTLLYWSIIIVIGLLSFMKTENFTFTSLLLPLIMIILIIILDFRINEQILSLESYRKVFYESDNENYFRETAKIKYFELEENKMNFVYKIFHLVFDHAQFQICYSVILFVCLSIIWTRVTDKNFTFFILSICTTLSLILIIHIQYFKLNSRRRKKEELWKKVKEEIKLFQHTIE